eukprot:CAMPEP_0113663460 /NCGR_PEP_ID=MMETSP0038_2-20120614/1153_1 /TAXON_ID=2898 /ORGANISM="Cryptomonas paramecium" /LENGTH=220 /DNA_ID=CAMNT_0000578487 /DNA_START=22 /DNA_END=680 /DNA_ORIENTATION=+ /assembly_acc=CAM_ASM_000170
MTDIRVGGVPEHFNLPWHIAKGKGLFEAKGLNMTWKDYPGGTGAMIKDLNEGSLDVAVLLTEGIVKDISSGGDSQLVAVYVQSPLVWAILTGSGQSIEKVEDLDNKIWAISRMGSGSHLMAVLLAEQQGWNKENLRFEIVNNLEGAREALREKPEAPARANGFLWEKFMTKPLVDQGEFRRVGEIPTPWPCFVVAVRRPFLAQHSEAVRDLLDALRPVTA